MRRRSCRFLGGSLASAGRSTHEKAFVEYDGSLAIVNICVESGAIDVMGVEHTCSGIEVGDFESLFQKFNAWDEAASLNAVLVQFFRMPAAIVL